MLGTPLGDRDSVKNHVENTTTQHQLLMEMIPLLEDPQSFWLLLVHCTTARANYLTRAVEFKTAQNNLEMCLHKVEKSQPRDMKESASMPLVLGKRAARTNKPTCWSNWQISFVVTLENPTSPILQIASHPETELTGMMEFVPPSWAAPTHGERPPMKECKNREPGTS